MSEDGIKLVVVEKRPYKPSISYLRNTENVAQKRSQELRNIPNVDCAIAIISTDEHMKRHSEPGYTDALLRWAVFGEGTIIPDKVYVNRSSYLDANENPGCDVCVGIDTITGSNGQPVPEEWHLGRRAVEMAKTAGKEFMLLKRYSIAEIANFVHEVAPKIKSRRVA